MKRVWPAIQDAATVVSLRLEDGAGTPIPASAISEAWLTVWNGEDAGTILNSRDHVDINNAGDVAIGEDGDDAGVLTWAVQAADNTIQSTRKAPGECELHLFEIEVHHSLIQSPFRGLYGLRVKVMQKGVHA